MGFLFFAISLLLVALYYDDVEAFLREKYTAELGEETERLIILTSKLILNSIPQGAMKSFLILSVINMFGFLFTFVQLLIAKPTSKKIICPLVFFASTAFLILIAIDFYIEIHLSHMPPKEIFTQSKENKSTKSKARFKMAYLIIYMCLCIVGGFMYLAYKDLEEYLENQKTESEPLPEITISHIA